MRFIVLITLLLIGILFSNPTTAKGMMFGEEDTLHHLQDIEMKGPEGENLSLAYRTTTTFFVAGVYIKKQGYVLSVKGNQDMGYYPLDEKQIQEFQTDGDLPSPLPVYELTALDYALGYSLWFLIGLFTLFYGSKKLLLLALAKK